jgi:hypothetical protein
MRMEVGVRFFDDARFPSPFLSETGYPQDFVNLTAMVFIDLPLASIEPVCSLPSSSCNPLAHSSRTS